MLMRIVSATLLSLSLAACATVARRDADPTPFATGMVSAADPRAAAAGVVLLTFLKMSMATRATTMTTVTIKGANGLRFLSAAAISLPFDTNSDMDGGLSGCGDAI